MSSASDYILRNTGQLLTFSRFHGNGPLGKLKNGMVVVSQGNIQWVGEEGKLPSEFQNYKDIDVGGALVTPGLVDCHTHLLFGGVREEEFFDRLQGETYEKIAIKGGGIKSTVAATRSSSNNELLEATRKRLDRFWEFGVTTVEVKSGYGLSTEEEIRILRLIQNLKSHRVSTKPTFLGAHTIPNEFSANREAYVETVCEEMLPRVKEEKLADCCDVFCEVCAFTLEETERILRRAKELGFEIKLHAEQLSNTKSTELGVKYDAISVDHLEHISKEGIQALAKSQTIGVLLPGAVFSLGKNTYPPARDLLAAGVKLALSTDCNPGTSFSENLPLMMSLAAIEMKMTAEEIWPAVTVHGAEAMGLHDRGILEKGKRADLVVWDAEDYREIPYHYGAIKASKVFAS